MAAKSVVFYMHAGSGNHGCEAIVNSTCGMLEREVDLLSARPWEDEAYSLKGMCRLLGERRITEHFMTHLYYFMRKLLTRDAMCYVEYRFQAILEKHYDIAVSIGGDNYCYPEQVEELMLLNRALTERGSVTVLWGVSLEPSLLERADVREDMLRYSHIFARERLTYQALLAAGIPGEKLHFYPDPAFCLRTAEVRLPQGFAPGNTVGVNISPMIIGKETAEGMTLANYRTLMQRILDTTEMQIALLSHVVWESNNDRSILQKLYDEFAQSGRVILLPDCDCMQLKGYIAELRFLVAARTHASIAAYSSMVPTLVVGYSVKAEGIAGDLFGTNERYVLPVQKLREKEDLWQAFCRLYEHEDETREMLRRKIPGYVEQAKAGCAELKRLLERRQ